MKALIKLLWENKFILFFILLTCVGIAVLTLFVLKPAYTSSSSKLYTSKLGHLNMLRKAGKPLPVKITRPVKEEISINVIGEGVCSSQPVLVPIIPMAPVMEVLVKEGDLVKKGDLLATLANTKAIIKRDSAKLALSTAQAELERVRLGSAYVLAQERPESERISLASILQQQQFASEKLTKFEEAFEKGVISKVKLLEARMEHTKISERLTQAELSTKIAEQGVEESKKIAENSVSDARQALAHREEELKSFSVFAPVDGVIDQVLINPGEYNQDSGKPGFLISSGLWFDAYFDQSDYSYVKKGLEAKVTLEAVSGQSFVAEIDSIKPIVSFNSGGPEISRPLRPRGTGSPEWAATFKARLLFQGDVTSQVVTGMTGFSRIDIKREAITVPKAAVQSISAGAGVVNVVNDDESWEVREVRVGHVNDRVAEILEGLTEEDSVMIDGHWTLKIDDEITVQR